MNNSIQTKRGTLPHNYGDQPLHQAAPERQLLMAMLEDGEWETVLVQTTGTSAKLPGNNDTHPQELHEIFREVHRDGRLGNRFFYKSGGLVWQYPSAALLDPIHQSQATTK